MPVKNTCFDDNRIALFEHLRSELDRHNFKDLPAKKNDKFLPFFESYFSNFIEGNEFDVSEASDIIFNGIIPEDRPEDALDILSTWQLVSEEVDLATLATTPEEFLDLICSRHAILLEAWPRKNPGEFKTRANRSGNTSFVAPDLVRGTLMRGFDMLDSIRQPMARAIFIMFLIAEVHPFTDGNGRIARVQMNAELCAAGQERIIIPPGLKSAYLQALRSLTHDMKAEPIINTLAFAQNLVHGIDFSDCESAIAVLKTGGAFSGFEWVLRTSGRK